VAASGVIHLGISDHDLIYAIQKVAIKPIVNKPMHKVVNIRSNLPWSNLDCLLNVNDRWDLWKKIFMTVVDKHGPFKSKRLRNKNNPWMTPEIKTVLINRDKLKRKAVISNDTDHWLHFKLARNKCNNMLKEAKRDYTITGCLQSTREIPISVLSVISKVFERIVFDQLYAYFNENNLSLNKVLGEAVCTFAP
jgi:hypothetical protein